MFPDVTLRGTWNDMISLSTHFNPCINDHIRGKLYLNKALNHVFNASYVKDLDWSVKQGLSFYYVFLTE